MFMYTVQCECSAVEVLSDCYSQAAHADHCGDTQNQQNMMSKLTASTAALWTGLLLCCCQIDKGECAKILNIAFMSTKSMKITYEPLLRELARRGHEVTSLSPIPGKDEKNFKTILTVDAEAMLKKAPNMFELKLFMPKLVDAILNPFLLVGSLLTDLCIDGYKLPQVQQVLEEKWDLIIFTPFFNDCLYGLIHKLNTTLILYSPTTVGPWLSDNLGTPSPPSFVSSLLIGYDDRMNFGQRLFNFARTLFDWAIMNLYYFPKMEAIYRNALWDPSIPSIQEIERNASIVLTNSQISFNPPRPLLPDIIEVGGMHLLPAKPVPKDLDDFLSGGKDGFILFSMGSALKGSMMPESYRKMFLNVFSKLKQRVIWKWETEQMDDLPPNVKLSKWLPQQDVLGHKDIRLFITHGGYGSTAEAIYHGVPLIGIPMVGDQPSNMLKAAQKGFALPPLDFSTLTEEVLLDAINKILDDRSYSETAKKLSAIYLDQMNKPLDRGVYWVEYVLRHQGALHLRSAARDLNYVQYFSLDVIAVLLVLLLGVAGINIIIIKTIIRKCCRSKVTKVAPSRKKKQ